MLATMQANDVCRAHNDSIASLQHLTDRLMLVVSIGEGRLAVSQRPVV